MRYDTAQESREGFSGKMKTVGILGLGSIGMRHGRNLTAMGHQVIGFDPINIGEGFPSIWPIPDGGLKKLDAIIIANPTELHTEALSQTPYSTPVFMEKPIGASQKDYDWFNPKPPMQSNVLRQIAMVGYNLRFHGCVKKAKEWLDSGMIGEPLWANFTLGQHSIKPPYLRDGVILNWSHEIDLALYLLGDATVMGSSTGIKDGKDYMTDILLAHQQKPWLSHHREACRSTIHLDYITNPEYRCFKIIGSGGYIFFDLGNRYGTLISGSEISSYEEDDTWNDDYMEEMQAFLDRIDGKETIGCSGAEGLRVLEICLEVRKQAGL